VRVTRNHFNHQQSGSTTINSYYKNNFRIGYLNVNSILGKADKVINLLDECAFDILLLLKARLMGLPLLLCSHTRSIVLFDGTEKEGEVDNLFILDRTSRPIVRLITSQKESNPFVWM